MLRRRKRQSVVVALFSQCYSIDMQLFLNDLMWIFFFLVAHSTNSKADVVKSNCFLPPLLCNGLFRGNSSQQTPWVLPQIVCTCVPSLLLKTQMVDYQKHCCAFCYFYLTIYLRDLFITVIQVCLISCNGYKIFHPLYGWMLHDIFRSNWFQIVQRGCFIIAKMLQLISLDICHFILWQVYCRKNSLKWVSGLKG